MSSTCPQNMANISPLTAVIGSGVWGTPANFNGFRVLPLLLHRRKPIKLCTMFGRLLGWYSIHFRRLLPLHGILPDAKFTLCPSLAFSYIGILAAGVIQTMRHGTTRNGIMELSQKVPPTHRVTVT